MPEDELASPVPRAPQVEVAAALRRLAALCVTTEVGDEVLARAADELSSVADRLASRTSPAGKPRFHSDYSSDAPVTPNRVMPFDMVVGVCNPIAPPVAITFDPPRALGRARYTESYEGAPGWVHGAAVAAAFDMVLTAANMVHGVAGPTVSLTLRYLRPTLLGQDCHFEAWVEEVRGRRVIAKGRLVQDDGTSVEATGEFVSLDYQDVQARSRVRRDGDD